MSCARTVMRGASRRSGLHSASRNGGGGHGKSTGPDSGMKVGPAAVIWFCVVVIIAFVLIGVLS
jgi:hypothetical protein